MSVVAGVLVNSSFKLQVSAAGDVGSSGVYGGVGHARETAKARAVASQADVAMLRNELATFLANAHAAMMAYQSDAEAKAAVFKGLESGLDGDAGRTLSPAAQAEVGHHGHSSAPQFHPANDSMGGTGDSGAIR